MWFERISPRNWHAKLPLRNNDIWLLGGVAPQDAIPIGIGMDGARAVLRSKGIQFQEQGETSQAIVLDRQDRSITAAGDHVISARLETEASQFPCGYDIEVVLLFGPDERLKDSTFIDYGSALERSLQPPMRTQRRSCFPQTIRFTLPPTATG
jgi:hypothetical protein